MARRRKNEAPGKPDYKVDEEVLALDVSAQAFGVEPWRKAAVTEVLWEDNAWWVRVKFADGGRSSILKSEGVRRG